MNESFRLTPEQTARVVEIAMELAREGRTGELIEFIEHGLPADTVDHDGNSLLMLAAYHGHTQTVAALLQAGADLDLRNNRDQCSLAGAIFKGEGEVTRVLLAAGADPDAGTPSARQVAEMFGQSHLIEGRAQGTRTTGDGG